MKKPPIKERKVRKNHLEMQKVMTTMRAKNFSGNWDIRETDDRVNDIPGKVTQPILSYVYILETKGLSIN